MHAARPEEITATILLSTSLATDEAYAAEPSTDPGVLAGAVTRFVLDSPGQRTAVVLYVGGTRQDTPYISNDRQILANGLGPRRVR